MDPVLKRVQRAVKEARERGGMTVGMPKVTLDCNDVVRLLTVAYRCPHIVTSDEGTSYCALGETRVRELEAERDQWQESSGQNYVRATEAEMREERLEAENRRLRALMACALDWSESHEDTQMCETLLREALEPADAMGG